MALSLIGDPRASLSMLSGRARSPRIREPPLNANRYETLDSSDTPQPDVSFACNAEGDERRALAVMECSRLTPLPLARTGAQLLRYRVPPLTVCRSRSWDRNARRNSACRVDPLAPLLLQYSSLTQNSMKVIAPLFRSRSSHSSSASIIGFIFASSCACSATAIERIDGASCTTR